MPVIRSTAGDQHEILKSILDLYLPAGIECDITYGSGQFYRDIPVPSLRFDIDPQVEGVVEACSTDLPVASASLKSVMFDPPFLTYIRSGRDGNGKMALGRRFSGYWSYQDLAEHYSKTLREISRVLSAKGFLVFKCQDIVHNHRLHPTHISAVGWASDVGLRLKDLFVLTANHRMPSPNRAGKQKHARIFHSYFLVFERV